MANYALASLTRSSQLKGGDFRGHSVLSLNGVSALDDFVSVLVMADVVR